MWPLSNILQIGELVAAFAVVVSVGFVVVEIRQNSEAQIRSTTQEAVSNYISSLERHVDNPDFACLYIRGAQNYRALSGADRLRFSAYYMSTYYQLQHYIDNLIQDNQAIEDYLFNDDSDQALQMRGPRNGPP